MCDLLGDLKTLIPVVFLDFQYAGEDDNHHPFYTKLPHAEAKLIWGKFLDGTEQIAKNTKGQLK